MHPLELMVRFRTIQARYAHKDTRNSQIKSIREGKISEVAPDLFPMTGPWQEPIVANLIDIAARDMAEMVAPLPSFNCSSPSMISESARKKATLRTKVAMGITTHSNLQVQMYSAADAYVSYGALPMRVEIDYDSKMPYIKALSPLNFYPEFDRWGRLHHYFQRTMIHRDALIAAYPEARAAIQDQRDAGLVEVIFYHDKNEDLAIMSGSVPLVLARVKNPLGKVMASVAQRPGATEVPRGQFDDVIFVQLARARFMLLSLQIATESANAPLVVPQDVPEIPMGPGATIRTNGRVERVKMDVPRDVFTEAASLEHELQQGSRFPSVRAGNADTSVVTGKGVQALLGGYDSQVRSHQAILANTFQEVMSIAFEVDEKVFGGSLKTLRGAVNGTPYAITYDPAKAIDGDYTVDVRYGLMAGLDPNRWLVFGLQARAEKLMSRDFLRREMPVDMDAEEEARKVDLEDLEESAKMAIQGYAQAIPALASQGQDPSGPIQALAMVIELRRKGSSISDAVVKAFTPKPPPEPSPEEQAMMAAQGGQMTAEGGQAPGGDGPAPGITADGRLDGVAAGQQGELPGGRPDLNMMLAGLDSRGGPNLQATISRQKAF